MPQFEFYSFPEQNFFLILAFFIVYFYVIAFYLPRLAEVLKMRKKLRVYYTAKDVKKAKLDLVSAFYEALLKGLK